MTSQKQLLFAYGLALHLLVVGVVCYAVFSTKVPDEPIRIMYKTNAGKVLFDHSNHCSTTGYGISCSDCHHHPSDFEETTVTACNSCHKTQVNNASIANSCLDCHESEDIEETEMLLHSDAFHNQCVRCHEELESGPIECAQCHVS